MSEDFKKKTTGLKDAQFVQSGQDSSFKGFHSQTKNKAYSAAALLSTGPLGEKEREHKTMSAATADLDLVPLKLVYPSSAARGTGVNGASAPVHHSLLHSHSCKKQYSSRLFQARKKAEHAFKALPLTKAVELLKLEGIWV